MAACTRRGRGRGGGSSLCLSTHQPDQQEADEGDLSQDGGAGDVSKSHRAHRHHQEVDAVPVAQVVHLAEVGRVAGVLQLVRVDRVRCRVEVVEVVGFVCVSGFALLTYTSTLRIVRGDDLGVLRSKLKFACFVCLRDFLSATLARSVYHYL